MGYVTENQPHEEPERDDVPDGTIATAVVKSITPKEISWRDKVLKDENGQPLLKTATLLKFCFEITEGDYVGRRVWGEVDAVMTTRANNRYRNWAETILGRTIPPHFQLDTDDLLDLPVKISVVHQPDKKDDSRYYVKVDELLPAGQGFSFDDEPPF